MSDISLHFEDTSSFELPSEQTTTWVNDIVSSYQYRIEELNYVFCSDDYLLDINRKYLEHDYYTDIITFDNSIEKGQILGDIFISVDRVRDNAREYGVTSEKELLRVMAHGVLHLCGFKDKSEEEQKEMSAKEDEALSLSSKPDVPRGTI